jgi:hypothetical protein
MKIEDAVFPPDMPKEMQEELLFDMEIYGNAYYRINENGIKYTRVDPLRYDKDGQREGVNEHICKRRR